MKLLAFCPGGAGHAGQLLVEAEVVLKGDRRVGHAFALDLHAFLGLDGLVQTIRPAAPVHKASGELIDDDHLAVLNDVLLVEVIEGMRLESGVDEAREAEVFRVVQVLDANRLFNLRSAFVRERDALVLDVDDVVYLLLEPGHDAGEGAVDLLGLLGRAADDERRARLVDQDRVDLVDNGIRMRRVFALHRLRQVLDHVVAQVVEAELVIGAVRDIGAISLATRGGPKVAEARVLEVRGRVVYVRGVVLEDAD